MNEWFTVLVINALSAISLDNISILLALVAAAALTDIGVPFPFVLETVLFTVCTQAGPFSIQVVLIIITFWLGRQSGTALLYLLTKKLGSRIIDWLGKYFRNLSHNLVKAEAKLGHWAYWGITVARLTPGLLQLSSVAAGILRVRYYHVFLGVTLSSLIYDCVFILLGFVAAKSLHLFGAEFSIWIVIGVFLTFGLVTFLYRFIGKNR